MNKYFRKVRMPKEDMHGFPKARDLPLTLKDSNLYYNPNLEMDLFVLYE